MANDVPGPTSRNLQHRATEREREILPMYTYSSRLVSLTDDDM